MNIKFTNVPGSSGKFAARNDLNRTLCHQVLAQSRRATVCPSRRPSAGGQSTEDGLLQ